MVVVTRPKSLAAKGFGDHNFPLSQWARGTLLVADLRRTVGVRTSFPVVFVTAFVAMIAAAAANTRVGRPARACGDAGGSATALL